MRLDVLLVKRGLFNSRQRAKEAIRRGFVSIEGEIVEKASREVKEDARIEILCNRVDVPVGYWKLKWLDGHFKLINPGDIVLDLGSSAGGFLLYASEKAKRVYGIECSSMFREALRGIEATRANVRFFPEDVFKFDIQKIEDIDVILNDLTLDGRSSKKALNRFLPKLKPGGRVLFIHKTGFERGIDFSDIAELEVVAKLNAEDRRKKEIYYLLQHPKRLF